ncbi:MAG TPA: DUF4465 domain-containing protein, partial [Salinivirgaceae bacterium]|nr:DUF4465 domain-containing protein [Salinivirgaceae bacterium]
RTDKVTEAPIKVSSSKGVATFDDLYLEPESYYWGDPEQTTSVFYSGSYSFSNTLMAEYYTWAGFAYSNRTATTFVNLLTDQFNSAVGHGVNNSENYAVAFTMGDPTQVTLTHNEDGDTVNGFYITNNAWVVYVSENGTGLGDEPNTPFHEGDWFKVIATADNGNTAEFYLADYRSENANHHYTLESWQWFDLRSLGKVKHICFSTDGTRPNMYGCTIPSYFCMDDFGGERNILTASAESVMEYDTINVDLTSLFDSLNLPTNFPIYQIADAPDEELVSATINENTLQLIGNKEGNTSIVIRQIIKGESIFVKIPIEVILNNVFHYNVTFTVKDANNNNPIEDVTIVIDDNTLTTNASGETTTKLPNGDYSYTATKTGYNDSEGMFTINGSDQTVNVNMTVGIGGNTENIVLLYPNPVNNTLTIERNYSDEVVIEIYNSSGTLVKTTKTDNTTTTINVEMLCSGTYFVKITGINNTTIHKFIKK